MTSSDFSVEGTASVKNEMGGLLPCPFCGGKARLQKYASGHDIPYISWAVWCETPDCRVKTTTFPDDEDAGIADATEAWNRRAAPPRDQVSIGALREAAERAYGILWRDIDRSSPEKSVAARKELFAVLTKDGQKRGIEYAIGLYGPTTEQEVLNITERPEGYSRADHIAHDMRMGRFPEQSTLEAYLSERAALSHPSSLAPTAEQGVAAKALDMPTDPEWYMRKAKLEEGHEVGVGYSTVNPTAEQIAEYKRLALKALPEWAQKEPAKEVAIDVNVATPNGDGLGSANIAGLRFEADLCDGCLERLHSAIEAFCPSDGDAGRQALEAKP